ncbi:MAG: di-heme oxidoredictase family protein, partial [Candidatus Binatia bacterium]
GRFVAFATSDPTLVAAPPGYGGVMGGSEDVFVRDRLLGRTTTWADGAPAGRIVRTASYRPVLSFDGRHLAFFTRFGPMFRSDGSDGKNHVELYVHDRVSGTTATRSIQASDGAATTVLGRGIAISADGRTVAFDSEGTALVVDDHNAARDVFVDSCPVVVVGAGFTFCDPAPFPALGAAELAVFARGAAQFERVDVAAEGLGPVFNGASCAECHNRPWIGGTSDRRVTRIGTTGAGGFDPLLASGGPVLQSQGITTPTCTVAGEVVPSAATIVSPRDVPALFGVGLIESLPDAAILRLADPTDANRDGISGRPNFDGGRVGRFGRKAQIATLRTFAGEAYLTEMGITSPEFPTESLPQGAPLTCDPVSDPEDDGTNVARFVDFLAGLAPIPSGRYADATGKRIAIHGRSAFRRIGCALCHSERLRVAGTVLRPLGLKKVTIFSDLLLHDLGPGLADGIAQGAADGNEFRTAPLWGVAFSAPYLHDGRAATLDAAILAHGGEAQTARDAFATLAVVDRAAILAFLGSL